MATGTNAAAVGLGAQATFANSAAFGSGAVAARANQQVYGTASNTHTMPGITSAASRAAQSGPTQIVTSDAGGNLATTTLNALGFATTDDVNAINSRLGALGAQVNDLTRETRRGIAAAVALGGTSVPLKAGQTAFSMGTGFYRDAGAFSLNVSHRLKTAMPIYLSGGYANGGGSEHVGRGAVTVVW